MAARRRAKRGKPLWPLRAPPRPPHSPRALYFAATTQESAIAAAACGTLTTAITPHPPGSTIPPRRPPASAAARGPPPRLPAFHPVSADAAPPRRARGLGLYPRRRQSPRAPRAHPPAAPQGKTLPHPAQDTLPAATARLASRLSSRRRPRSHSTSHPPAGGGWPVGATPWRAAAAAGGGWIQGGHPRHGAHGAERPWPSH